MSNHLASFHKCNNNMFPVSRARVANSVTSKKVPNVYKSCPKMILLEKWRFWHIYKTCIKFGQNNLYQRLWKVSQSEINRPIWSHWWSRASKAASIKAHGPLSHSFHGHLYYLLDGKRIINEMKVPNVKTTLSILLSLKVGGAVIENYKVTCLLGIICRSLPHTLNVKV